MDLINEYLKQYEIVEELNGYTYRKNAPLIKCKDGVNLSVQAGAMLYCTPRTDYGPYSKVEVGFPSIRPPDAWEEYYDGGGWQVTGIIGTLARWLNDRSMIWWGIKESVRTKRINFSLRHKLSLRDNATNSVYAWIPIELVNEFIESHGGIDYDQTESLPFQ